MDEQRRSKPTRRHMLASAALAVTAGLACPCCGARAKAEATASAKASWYDEVFAYALSKGQGSYEEALAPLKEELFPKLAARLVQLDGSTGQTDAPLQGDPLSAGDGVPAPAPPASTSGSAPLRVLEVGIGGAPNLAPLVRSLTALGPEGQRAVRRLEVVGVDKNVAFQKYAREAAQAAGLREEQLDLVLGDATRLPFPDASFDAAVCTLVMCSVPDPAAALREVHRVLRPGRPLLLVEHVAAGWEQDRVTRALQEALTPLQQVLADGCHLNRETRRTLEAGQQGGGGAWETSELVSGQLAGVPGIIQPHLWGLAIASA